jgi:hypothetical protein
MDTFDFTAVGMRFVEAAPRVHSRALLGLTRVLLVPEPDNPVDHNAVKVCDPG